MRTRKDAPPRFEVIEGGRDLKKDVEGVLEALRETRQLMQRHLDHAYDRAERAEERAERAEKRVDDALAAERIAREEAAGLRAELGARRQWSLGRRLRWALSRKR